MFKFDRINDDLYRLTICPEHEEAELAKTADGWFVWEIILGKRRKRSPIPSATLADACQRFRLQSAEPVEQIGEPSRSDAEYLADQAAKHEAALEHNRGVRRRNKARRARAAANPLDGLFG